MVATGDEHGLLTEVATGAVERPNPGRGARHEQAGAAAPGGRPQPLGHPPRPADDDERRRDPGVDASG